MKRSIVMGIACLAAAGAASAAEPRVIEGRAKVASDQEVRLDFPVGELEIVGVDGDTLEIVVEIRCKGRRRARCEDTAEQIELDIDESRGTLYVEIEPHSKWQWWDDLEIEARVKQPADRPLRVDMGVGELVIEGLAADLQVDLGVGEASVDMSVDAVRSVFLDAGIGETELLGPKGWVRDERSFFIGSESSWRDGPGEARVHVEVGVGEASVRLDG